MLQLEKSWASFIASEETGRGPFALPGRAPYMGRGAAIPLHSHGLGQSHCALDGQCLQEITEYTILKTRYQLSQISLRQESRKGQVEQ